MKKTKNIIIVLVFMLPILIWAHNTDELKRAGVPDSLISKILQSNNKEQVIEGLNEIGFIMTSYSPQLALDYGQEALIMADSLKFIKGQMNAHNVIGLAFYRTGFYEPALEHFKTTLNLAIKLKLNKTIASAKSNMALVFTALSNYERAIDLNNEALVLRQNINDSAAIAISYNNLGNCFHYEKNYREAIKNYRLALDLRNKINDKNAIATTLHNIGQVYFEMYSDINTDALDSALSYFLNAYYTRQRENNKVGCAESLMNIGNAYSEKNSFYEASNSYRAALNIQNQINDRAGQALTLHNIGVLMIKQKNIPEAITNFNKSLLLSRTIKKPELIRDNLKNLASIYTQQNDINKAFIYLNECNNLTDSLANVLLQEQYHIVREQLRVHKNEYNEMQLQSIDNCKYLKKAFIIVSILLIITVGFGFWYFIFRKPKS